MKMLVSKLNVFTAVQKKVAPCVNCLIQGWWRSGLFILTFSYLGPPYLEQLFSKQVHNLDESYRIHACRDPAVISKL